MEPAPTETTPTHHDLPAPNHHAHHPGFSGLGGLVAAVGFLFGRGRAADLAVELSGLRPGARLVDVGCGPGVAADHARKIGAEVIGVDPAAMMLRVARLRWPTEPERGWRLGSAESLPVDDDWAQVVWSLATVHHWHDLAAALAEARRVLAPGGRLVVLERRIQDLGAGGVASHGWTPDQAESFALRCRRAGFVDPVVGTHAGSPDLLSVVAHTVALDRPA